MVWHQLRANASCRTPSSLVFLDTETYTTPSNHDASANVHTFRLGCAIGLRLEEGEVTRRDILEFSHPNEWWDWLWDRCDKIRPIWIWAHNIGFDATILDLWGRIDAGVLDLRRLVTEDPPTIIRTVHQKGRQWWVDTLNYWRCPLRELGDSIGLAKLPMPAWVAPDSEWATYCRRDAEIIERAVLGLCGLIRSHDIGVMSKTAPGLSWNNWRHTCTASLPEVHERTAAKELERRCLYGGQCECYYLGPVAPQADTSTWAARPTRACDTPQPIGPVYHLDVSALYPSVMRCNVYPVKLVGHEISTSWETLEYLCREYAVCADVLIASPTDTYPVREGDYLLFAKGQFWTSLCGPELLRALRSDHICRVGSVSWYYCEDLFTAWVDTWWQRRLEYEAAGDKANADLCKLVMNSLAGKFGQHMHRWDDRVDHPYRERWDRWCEMLVRVVCPQCGGAWDCDRECKRCQEQRAVLREYRTVAGLCQLRQRGGEGSEAIPVISALIHAHARERMRSLRAMCPDGSVLYQDTDSLHVTAEGRDRLVLAGQIYPRELGQLRDVDTYQTVTYRGIRDYQHDGKDVIAGIPRQAAPVADNDYECEEFERLESVIGRKPDPRIYVRRVRKHLDRTYRHGVVGRDGWVSPPYLGEIK